MKRWTFNCFCLFSLLVFSLSVTLWVRSYWVFEHLQRWEEPSHIAGPPARTRTLSYGGETSRGMLWLFLSRADYQLQLNSHSGWNYSRGKPIDLTGIASPFPIRANFHLGRFHFVHTLSTSSGEWDSDYNLQAPLWLFLPAAIPPILWWRKWRKRCGQGFPVDLCPATAPVVQQPDAKG